MILKLALLLTTLLPSANAQMRSIVLSGGITGTSANPTGQPLYSAVQDVRIEFRIHGDTTSTSGYWALVYNDRLDLRVYSNGSSQKVVSAKDWIDGSTPQDSLNVSGWDDVLVRYQRCYSCIPQQTMIEAWKADGSARLQGGTSTAMATTPNWQAVPWKFGSVSLSTNLAYVRIFNTVLPFNSTPPSVVGGNMAEWEFTNNTNDSSGLGLDITMSTGPSYIDTPIVPPIPVLAGVDREDEIAGKRAGNTPLTLDGTGSYSVNDTTITSCFWNVYAGSAEYQHITNNYNCLSSSNIYKAGEYSYILLVTDGIGETNTKSFTVGSVASDSNNVVIGTPSWFSTIFGPVVSFGSAPWPWFDNTYKADLDALGPAVLAAVPSTLTTPSSHGTVTYTCTVGTPPNCTGSLQMVGTGTQFLTDFAANDAMLLIWTTPDGSTSYMYFIITSVVDDTHMLVNQGSYLLPDEASGQNLHYIAMPAGSATYTSFIPWNNQGNSMWNFYCGGVCPFYEAYYRTGLTKYLTYARFGAINWWQYNLGASYYPQTMRNVSPMGQVAATEDQYSNWWGRIPYISFFNSVAFDIVLPTNDARENGYKLWGLGLSAQLSPNPSDVAAICTKMASQTDIWTSGIGDHGQLPQQFELYSSGNYAYQGQGPTTGALPWHQAIGVNGLLRAYQAYADANVCNDSARASSTLSTAEGIASWIYNYGYDTVRRAIHYSADYPSAAQLSNFSPPGTVSTTVGSATVVGSSTNFTTTFSPCDGTTYIEFVATGARTVYKVNSCADATHLTMDQTFGSRNETSGNLSGSAYTEAPSAFTDCHSLATYCEPADQIVGTNGREYNPIAAGAFALLYKITGNTTYYNWAMELLGSMYGGPADGKGGSEAYSGPLADGTTTQLFGDAIPSCSTVPVPCGGSGPTVAYSKWTGEHTGAGNADGAMGMVTAVSPANTVSVGLSVKIDSVPNATKVRYTITSPDGTTATTTCTTSPCTVTADARQAGVALVTIEYLDTGNNVLATGIPQAIPIQ